MPVRASMPQVSSTPARVRFIDDASASSKPATFKLTSGHGGQAMTPFSDSIPPNGIRSTGTDVLPIESLQSNRGGAAANLVTGKETVAALRNHSRKWSFLQGWREALNRFQILWPERMPLEECKESAIAEMGALRRQSDQNDTKPHETTRNHTKTGENDTKPHENNTKKRQLRNSKVTNRHR